MPILSRCANPLGIYVRWKSVVHLQPPNGHADMTTLGDTGEWALLHNLRERFKADEIYTYVMLVSVSAITAVLRPSTPIRRCMLAGISATFSSPSIPSKNFPVSARMERGYCACLSDRCYALLIVVPCDAKVDRLTYRPQRTACGATHIG
jgi:hypothetical protein